MPTGNGTYFNLGKYSRRVTTASLECQDWFDRGIVWLYAYNHEEAISCFEMALKHDGTCAMAHWGIAYALGPNYNLPWEEFDEEKKRSVLEDVGKHLDAIDESQISPVERSIVMAIRKRYCTVDSDDFALAMESFDDWHDSYADAMRTVYSNHCEDLDVCCLTAEALMNRTPWKLWNLKTGLPADGANTVEAIRIIEGAFQTLDASWDHPGLLHMYIHLMEMSPYPERALRQGDALGCLAPDAGHLIHMGTHVDVLCGDYESVVTRNRAATVADRKYLARAGGDNFYSVYRLHNYHFIVYGAMFLAQRSPALAAADELAENVTPVMLQDMADWLEAFIPIRQHVMVRFGMWIEIMDQPLPNDEDLYSFTTATMRYARVIAMANTDKLGMAEEELGLFREAKSRVPKTRILFQNSCSDILNVAEQMLLGELEFRKGNHDVGLNNLRKAIELDDNLTYDEPWGWMQPVRHALGALLLERGQFDEAEIVYREDLGLTDNVPRSRWHLNNVWSLHGLYECLQQRDERVESVHVKQQLDKAMARAEVPVHSSCFCRKTKSCLSVQC